MNLKQLFDEHMQDIQNANSGVDISDLDLYDSAGNLIKGVFLQYDHETGGFFVEISNVSEEDLEHSVGL